MEENKQQEETQFGQEDTIRDTGSITTKSSRGVIHCITIAGQIEGHQILPENTKTTKYEHIIPQLTAVEESDEIDGLLVLLNTPGGDVEAGLAIAELIAGMSKPTVSLVLGGGHSIGVPLAVAARRSFIAPSASMTIHPVRLTGMVIGVPQMLESLQKTQQRIVDFITSHSGVSEQTLLQLMMKTGEMPNDVGTIVGGQEAVEIGLCDEIGSLSQALDCLHQMMEQKA